MKTFRLATINVHSFNHPSTYEDNTEALVEILTPLELDLIAVQEVPGGTKWSTFCDLLAFPHRVLGSNEEQYYLNGIASRYPIKTHWNQQVDDKQGGAERRSLLSCSLDSDHPFTRNRLFAVTHLDHMNESARLFQMLKFNPLEQMVDILMGDMNALTREDYSDHYFEQSVVRVRKSSAWERPMFDVTQLITGRWSYQDAFKQINPHLRDEQTTTCRFGTRVDYIYLRPRADDSWTLKECSIINTQDATDHNIVLAQFEEK